MRAVLIVLALVGGAGGARAGESPFEYLDFRPVEVVGEIDHRSYDLREQAPTGGARYAGNVSLGRGVLPAGGFGLGLVMRFAPGVRVSLEGGVYAGRLSAVNGPFDQYGTVLRGEFTTGLGYEVTLGPVVLHTATLIGFDYQSLDVTIPVLSQPLGGVPASPPPGGSLEQYSLRAGQQIGLHVQVARAVALFADGTVDYDGQWRVNAGVSLGAPRRPPPRPAPALLAR